MTDADDVGQYAQLVYDPCAVSGILAPNVQLAGRNSQARTVLDLGETGMLHGGRAVPRTSARCTRPLWCLRWPLFAAADLNTLEVAGLQQAAGLGL